MLGKTKIREVNHDLEPVEAPDCGVTGCMEPARFQYRHRKTCSAGPYNVGRERCIDHMIEEKVESRTHDTLEPVEYITCDSVFGTVKGWNLSVFPWKWRKVEWAPLETDPHYFCKKNGEPSHFYESYVGPCPIE